MPQKKFGGEWCTQNQRLLRKKFGGQWAIMYRKSKRHEKVWSLLVFDQRDVRCVWVAEIDIE